MTPRPDEADRLWAALGDPTRIRLLDLLLECGEATASALAGALPITRQAISKHLAVLERDGLVTTRRSGREVLYTVREERLDEAGAAMSRIAERWDTRLTAIKKLAEQAADARNNERGALADASESLPVDSGGRDLSDGRVA